MSSVQNFTVGKFKEPAKDWSFLPGLRSVKTVENYKTGITDRGSTLRKRKESPVRTKKKGRNSEFFNIFVCLEDECSGVGVNFRGYYEELVVPKVVSEKTSLLQKGDEDCETEDDEIEISMNFLSSQLEEAVKYNTNS